MTFVAVLLSSLRLSNSTGSWRCSLTASQPLTADRTGRGCYRSLRSEFRAIDRPDFTAPHPAVPLPAWVRPGPGSTMPRLSGATLYLCLLALLEADNTGASALGELPDTFCFCFRLRHINSDSENSESTYQGDANFPPEKRLGLF